MNSSLREISIISDKIDTKAVIGHLEVFIHCTYNIEEGCILTVLGGKKNYFIIGTMKNKIFSNQYNSLWCFLILFAHNPPSTTSYEESWKVSILGFWKEYVKINITYDYTIEDERPYWEHSSSCEKKKRR